MQRTIDACGCEFTVDYEWDDEVLCLEGVYIDGNDLTDLIQDAVTDKIKDALYGLYHEDMADRADYAYEIRRAA